jgi:hypothetical protein
MKIAMCLSGGPRFKHRGLFKLMDALKGFDQADFFIRTWKTEDYGLTAQQFEYYLRSNGLDDRCHFKVTELLDDQDPVNHGPHIDLNLCGWAPNFLTMWWGALQSYNLYKDYVARTGEQYDLVFRMRTDMLPEGPAEFLDLRDYLEDAQTHMFNAQNFSENFLFGSPAMYERFMGYWDYFKVLSERRTFVHPEETLEAYFNEAGIPFKLVPMQVMPRRDSEEYATREQQPLSFDRP